MEIYIEKRKKEKMAESPENETPAPTRRRRGRAACSLLVKKSTLLSGEYAVIDSLIINIFVLFPP